MQQDLSQLIPLLLERLARFESLAREVTAGQEACVAFDLEKLQFHDQQKLRLTQEARRTDAAIASFLVQPSDGPCLMSILRGTEGDTEVLPGAVVARIRPLWEQSENARLEAERRNHVYAEFLRRAAMNVNVMMNVVSHCLGVYPREVFARSFRPNRERST